MTAAARSPEGVYTAAGCSRPGVNRTRIGHDTRWELAGLAGLAALLALVAGPAHAQPDLVVSVAPTQGLPDMSSVPISVTLRNLGDVGSPSTQVLIAIDGNPTDPPLDFGPVGAGASATLDASFTLGCGAHTATATVDAEGLINESDETNNAATAAVRVIPVPAFEWSLVHVSDGHFITLDATASAGCRPLNFEWTIVPGGTVSGEIALRKVPAGTLDVRLTVTSTSDATLRATTNQTVLVNNIPPWVTASVPGAALFTGSPCGLVVNATDVDGSIDSFEINMGDGSRNETTLAGAAQHAYVRPGPYNVVVTVRDNLGNDNETFLTITVLNRGPTARVVPAATTVAVGAPVSLSGLLSSDPEDFPGKPELSFQWSFGDGSVGSGASVDHAYGAAGEYTVTVTVTDEDGASSNGTARISVIGATTGAQGAAPDLPLLLIGLFIGATLVSFAYARSSRFAPARRTPPAPPRGSVDPARRSLEEE